MKSLPHAFALDAILRSGGMCLFHEKIMATCGVQSLCLTWIPAMWTVRHVLLERRAARRRVVSLTPLLFFLSLLFLAVRIHDAHCWLLCRPDENVISMAMHIYVCFNCLATCYCLNANDDFVCFLFNCPSENMASHSSRRATESAILPLSKPEQTDQEVVRPRDLLLLSPLL